MADGTIDPPTAPIEHVFADVYVLTGDITSISDGIVINRENATLDGQDHTIQGAHLASTVGVYISGKSNIAIRNLRITGYYYGLEIDSSSYIEISRCVIEGNIGDGIFLDEASHVNLTQNVVASNFADGIFLYWYSNQNDISGNMINNNSYRGIDLYGCHNNTIKENYVASNNMTGIYLFSSFNNTIFHNNIVDNNVQAETYQSQSIWDYPYPSGGNYWNDYSGTDLKTGPNQDKAGSDGIIDEPRVIDTNNSDSYPLTTFWGATYGDVNNDRTIDIYDAILLSNAFNSTPTDPNWNSKADLNYNESVDIFDAIILAAHFGKTL
jgi:parallel beta-helix repeat protein